MTKMLDDPPVLSKYVLYVQDLAKEALDVKIVFVFLLTLSICLTVLSGCTQKATQIDTQGTFCRVVCVKNGGIILDIEHVGYVYVKQIDTDQQIDVLDTVVMDFSQSDLIPETGDFLDFGGKERSYSYVLSAPKSIRLADSSIGEPTFG